MALVFGWGVCQVAVFGLVLLGFGGCTVRRLLCFCLTLNIGVSAGCWCTPVVGSTHHLFFLCQVRFTIPMKLSFALLHLFHPFSVVLLLRSVVPACHVAFTPESHHSRRLGCCRNKVCEPQQVVKKQIISRPQWVRSGCWAGTGAETQVRHMCRMLDGCRP